MISSDRKSGNCANGWQNGLKNMKFNYLKTG